MPIDLTSVSQSTYLLGRVATTENELVVRGPRGYVTFDGTPVEIAVLDSLLQEVRLGSATQLPVDVFDALTEVGAIIDVRDGWHWFHQLSSNPASVEQSPNPLYAYKMPRLSIMDGDSTTLSGGVRTKLDDLAEQRISCDFETVIVDREAAAANVLALAYRAYKPRADGRRPAASGGALYPIHLWTISYDGQPKTRVIHALDSDAGTAVAVGRITIDALLTQFLEDAGLDRVLRAGGAVIVIASDATRTVFKYGNRGWRHALMECGAISHHITLDATARGIPARPIAGFFDESLQSAVCAPAIPLLTIVVAG